MINEPQRFLVPEGQKDPKRPALCGIITGQDVWLSKLHDTRVVFLLRLSDVRPPLIPSNNIHGRDVSKIFA